MDVDAAPLMVGPTDFNLDSDSANSKKLESLKKEKPRLIGNAKILDEEFPIYRTGTNKGYVFIQINETFIGFLVAYEIRHIKGLPKTITQFALWRSKKLDLNTTFMSKLFFQVILPMTGSVLSDKEHTEYGKEFWKRRLQDALEDSKYSVSLVDLSGIHVAKVNTLQELRELFKEAWNTTVPRAAKEQKWKNLRWLISKV